LHLQSEAEKNRAGAFHGSEIPLVFGSTQYQQIYYSERTKKKLSFPDTPEQERLVKSMMKAWSTFAKDPENGLEKELKYPVYDPKSMFFDPLLGDNYTDCSVIAGRSNAHTVWRRQLFQH
jgi:cholinesterase